MTIFIFVLINTELNNYSWAYFACIYIIIIVFSTLRTGKMYFYYIILWNTIRLRDTCYFELNKSFTFKRMLMMLCYSSR